MFAVLLSGMAVGAASLHCEHATSNSIKVSWNAIENTDLYYIGIYECNNDSSTNASGLGRMIALDTVAAEGTGQKMAAELSQLRPGTNYSLLLRSHPSALPSTVWGWRNISAATVLTVCSTSAVGPGGSQGAPSTRRTAVQSSFTRMYRVSERTYEIDFLSNHNAGDLQGEVAFLSSGSPDGAPAFAKVPVTEYCVEHISGSFAPYISCNGPEAGKRNTPENPICICDVYADRMISLESMAEMDNSCGKSPTRPDGTHIDNPCNCSSSGRGNQSADWAKWTLPNASITIVGAQSVWLPYFYYQRPRPPVRGEAAASAYPGVRPFGEWYSLPRAGECAEGKPLGHSGCTWRRLPRARIVWGSELLKLGWNATYIPHWPLHDVGHNTTDQCLQNEPVLHEAFAALTAHVGAAAPCDGRGP
jgi:hypothetical protein